MNKKTGFTLIELLVTIVILAILMAGMFRMMKAVNAKTEIAKTTERVHKIMTLAENYKALYGDYPEARDLAANNDNKNSMDFIFLADPGSTSSKPDGDGEVVFGLLSRFCYALLIMENTSSDRMKSEYKRLYKSGAAPFQNIKTSGPSDSDTEWDEEISNSRDKTNTNLNQLERMFNKFVSEGVINAGSTFDRETKKKVYSATAKDAWGNSLIYEKNGEHGTRVYSLGADGQAGTKDDIVSSGR